jgi:hypothetical protein
MTTDEAFNEACQIIKQQSKEIAALQLKLTRSLELVHESLRYSHELQGDVQRLERVNAVLRRQLARGPQQEHAIGA